MAEIYNDSYKYPSNFNFYENINIIAFKISGYKKIESYNIPL